MYTGKQLRIKKDKININFLLEALYPYTLLQIDIIYYFVRAE